MVKTRHLAVILAAALCSGFVPHQRPASAKWALVVGINDYRNFGDEVGGDLLGAVNDARNLRDVLVARWGFEADHVKLLVDGEATRAAIEAAFTEWAPAVLRPGDQFLFFFAGHGSQMWDTDGDEEDGLDETFCPVDVIKGVTDLDVSDDQLARWLEALPARDIVVFWDKCHAGTSTRAVTPFARPRSLDRLVTEDVPAPEGARAARPGAAGESLSDRPAKPVLELAASGADEIAVDAAWSEGEEGEITYGGAFTTNLVRNLWQLPPGTSYSEVFRITREDLKRQRFAQTPEISGAADRPLFGLGEDAPASAVPVLDVSGRAVRLGGGAAAGMTQGSWYRAGDALLRVVSVAASDARAQLAEASPAPRAGEPAHLLAVRLPEPLLRVSVAGVGPESRAALAAALGREAPVRLVEESDAFAHLLVRASERGWRVLGLDGAVRHELASDAAALAALLAREAGAHRLALLENPAHPFALDFRFREDRTAFGLGETLEFSVTSAHDGYLTLVDLGTDGTVTVVFPNEYDADNRIGAGRTVVIPTAAMGFEFEAQPPVGRGIIRAFVTERPMRVDPGAGDPVAEVLRALGAAAGEPVAGGSPEDERAIPTRSWATASIVYRITE